MENVSKSQTRKGRKSFLTTKPEKDGNLIKGKKHNGVETQTRNIVTDKDSNGIKIKNGRVCVENYTKWSNFNREET